MGRKGENIYKRKDGRWEARYIKGYEVSGKAHYGYCYGKTYREAKRKVSYARAMFLCRNPVQNKEGEKYFSAYCDEWLLLKRSRIKESTYVKYEAILEKHIKPAFEKYEPEMISEVNVEQFAYELLHLKNLSAKTVRDILSVLHAVMDYAKRRDPQMASIMISYPKEGHKERRVLSCEEQECFVKYLNTEMDTCKFGVFLALMTGLRLGEICALRWSDISLTEGTLHVRHTMQRLKDTDAMRTRKTKVVISLPKSEQSIRVIPLNAELLGLCRKWKPEEEEAFVLTGKKDRYLEPRVVQYRMKHYTEMCGLEGVHFHTLRHSFATRCVEAGFEIKSLSEILGHSSTNITLGCYVHSSLELKRKNMEKLEKIHLIEK